jgi:hypothetical protein
MIKPRALRPGDRIAKSSQAKMMMEQHRFPFMFDWQGRLNSIVDRCNQVKTATRTKK